MSNQVYENQTVRYFDSEINNAISQLPQVPVPVTINLTGPFSSVPFNLKYIVFNNQVTLYWDAFQMTSTNGSSTLMISTIALPTAIIPIVGSTGVITISCPLIVNTNLTEVGYININSLGIINFSRSNAAVYPNGVPCGVNRTQISYEINL